MKFVPLFCLLAFLSLTCAAQDVCNLELKDAPALQNLRLGMTPDEVQTVFGRELKIKIKKNGNKVFFQNFIEKPAPQSLSGVRALYLRFFDRRLYQIEFFYENRTEWQTLEDFIRHLTTTLNLPDLWKDIKGRKTMTCNGFSLAADQVLNPRIELTDENLRAKAEEFLLQQKK